MVRQRDVVAKDDDDTMGLVARGDVAQNDGVGGVGAEGAKDGMAAESQGSSVAKEKEKTPEKKQWWLAGGRQKEKQSEIDILPLMAGGFRIDRKKVCGVGR